MRKIFLLILFASMSFAASVGHCTDPSQINFDEAAAITKWIAGQSATPDIQSNYFSSFFEKGQALALYRLVNESPNWKSIKFASYAFDRSFPADYADLVWTQQPFSIKRVPNSGFHFLENRNDPSIHLVASAYGAVFLDMANETSQTMARALLDELKSYDNEKAIYRSGVLELNDKGLLQFLSGADSLKYDWEDIILDANTRNGIQNSIDGFLNNYDREEWKRLGVPLSRGVLLDGPPGTGKSMVAKILMSRVLKKSYAIKPTFIYVSARHVFSKDSIRSIYAVARKFSPSIVFIEDVDLIAGTNRENKQDIKNELLQQLSGVEALDGVLTIATTNYGKLLDEALTRSRRLGFHYTVGMPAFAERLALFQLFLKKVVADSMNLNDFANRSEGMTGADIRELCRIATEKALRSGSKSSKKVILLDEHMNYAFNFRKQTKKDITK